MTTTPEAGMRLVPVKATYKMLEAGDDALFDGPDAVEYVWDAMLAAAPVPHAGGEGEVEKLIADLRGVYNQMTPSQLERMDSDGAAFVIERAIKALAARAQPHAGEVVNITAMREYAVAMTKKHGNPIGTDYEQGQNDMGYRWVHSFDDLPAAHPAEPAARFGSSAAPIPTEGQSGAGSSPAPAVSCQACGGALPLSNSRFCSKQCQKEWGR